jgi:hypothetical protein
MHEVSSLLNLMQIDIDLLNVALLQGRSIQIPHLREKLDLGRHLEIREGRSANQIQPIKRVILHALVSLVLIRVLIVIASPLALLQLTQSFEVLNLL